METNSLVGKKVVWHNKESYKDITGCVVREIYNERI